MGIQKDFEAQIEKLLVGWDKDREVNEQYIANAMRGNIDPISLSQRAIESWNLFLTVVQTNKDELNPFVFALPAANGMQLVFTRLSIEWGKGEKPKKEGTLSENIKKEIKSQATSYIGLIT